MGLGVHQHAAGELGVELRDGHGAGWAQDGVVHEAQHLRGGEDAHGVPVVQRDLLRIHPGEILEHADHGGIIVAQHVQLEQVGLHGVIFEVSGNDVAVGIVGGVLHRTEVVDLPVLGDDHHAAGVLAGGALDAGAALGQPVLLRPVYRPSPLIHVLLDIAEGGLFRHGADGARPEHVGLPEQLKGVPVGVGLIFAGEVQIDVGHLVAAEAQEGLEGDVEAVLGVGRSADGAHRVGHVRAAADPLLFGGVEVRVLALGTAVVGRQGVHLRDTRHEGYQGRAHGATGAH